MPSEQAPAEGVLYVVATPIGNLGDLSERAAEVLRNVSLIAAEDTRVTRKLLTRIGAHPRVVSYHENSPATRLREILAALDSGDVALVTDAGTPALSDPGSELVAAAAAAGRSVAAVPGPSAVAAALSIAGMPADRFLYLGFLPRQLSRRVETLRSASGEPGPLVILEAPHRVTATLETIADLFPNRAVAVCRELTKLFEEVYRGDAAGALEYFRRAARGVRDRGRRGWQNTTDATGRAVDQRHTGRAVERAVRPHPRGRRGRVHGRISEPRLSPHPERVTNARTACPAGYNGRVCDAVHNFTGPARPTELPE